MTVLAPLPYTALVPAAVQLLKVLQRDSVPESESLAREVRKRLEYARAENKDVAYFTRKIAKHRAYLAEADSHKDRSYHRRKIYQYEVHRDGAAAARDIYHAELALLVGQPEGNRS